MSGYAFHPDAFADLDEIWEYIAEDNVDAADRVLADIHSTLTTIAGSPQIGHRRPDLTTRPLRFHVARDEYLIAYAPAEKPLWVLAVFHGRRNPRLMAAVLRGREYTVNMSLKLTAPPDVSANMRAWAGEIEQLLPERERGNRP